MACVLTRVCVDVDVCARLDIVCVDVRAGVTHGFKVSMVLRYRWGMRWCYGVDVCLFALIWC